MASPTPKNQPRNNHRPAPRAHSGSLPEVVDPAWILKALAIVILGGLLCAYLTITFALRKAHKSTDHRQQSSDHVAR